VEQPLPAQRTGGRYKTNGERWLRGRRPRKRTGIFAGLLPYHCFDNASADRESNAVNWGNVNHARACEMTESEKQALAIYETIVATSGTRPTAFQTMEQLLRETAAWKANNPALAELGRAEPPVLLAFLAQSFDWQRAEAHLAKTITPARRCRREFKSRCSERRNRFRQNWCCLCSASTAGPWALWRTCFFPSGNSSCRSRVSR